MWFKNKSCADHIQTDVMSNYFFVFQTQEELVKHFYKEKNIEEWLNGSSYLVEIKD